MYTVITNYGSYKLKLMPSAEDVCKYWTAARKAGLEIHEIRFTVMAQPEPEYQSISTILGDVKP